MLAAYTQTVYGPDPLPEPSISVSIPFCVSALHALPFVDSTVMSNSNTSSPGPSQNQADILGAGIVGLFIEGLQTGLVLAQLSRWFSTPERNENTAFSAFVIFMTAVGLCVSFRLYIHIASSTIAADKVRRLGYVSHPLGKSTCSSLGRMYVAILPLCCYETSLTPQPCFSYLQAGWISFSLFPCVQ